MTALHADRSRPRAIEAVTFVLARHAQTVWHAENRYAGSSSDIDLTADGRSQVDALARWAGRRGLDAVVSSPVRRALETARPCARSAGRDLRVEEDLRELDFGVAEGRTLDELARTDPDVVARFREDPVGSPFPGAEPPERAAGRSAGALRRLAVEHGGDVVLVVAHNTLLRLAMCTLLDLPLGRYRQLFPRLDNGAVSELRVPVDPSLAASLLSLNSRLDLT